MKAYHHEEYDLDCEEQIEIRFRESLANRNYVFPTVESDSSCSETEDRAAQFDLFRQIVVDRESCEVRPSQLKDLSFKVTQAYNRELFNKSRDKRGNRGQKSSSKLCPREVSSRNNNRPSSRLSKGKSRQITPRVAAQPGSKGKGKHSQKQKLSRQKARGGLEYNVGGMRLRMSKGSSMIMKSQPNEKLQKRMKAWR